MITGAHAIIYSTDPDADRAFFRDVLEFPNVDVGGGWLIFSLPGSELAVHPSDKNNVHELYLMCDDIDAFIAVMTKRGIRCTPVAVENWGIRTQVTLPSGGALGVYQPRHARPSTEGLAPR
jgi:catechol 2,3-dioxygenase-like lactoylglutathione lyase family enzyme